MSEYGTVKLHKAQRAAKRDQRQKQRSYVLTPPKYFDGECIYNKFRTLEKKLGYHYECNQSKTLKWMHQQFEDKMVKYLGGGAFHKRLSRKEKVEMKERLNFKLQKNPVLTLFNRINHRLEGKLMRQGFEALAA